MGPPVRMAAGTDSTDWIACAAALCGAGSRFTIDGGGPRQRRGRHRPGLGGGDLRRGLTSCRGRRDRHDRRRRHRNREGADGVDAGIGGRRRRGLGSTGAVAPAESVAGDAGAAVEPDRRRRPVRSRRTDVAGAGARSTSACGLDGRTAGAAASASWLTASSGTRGGTDDDNEGVGEVVVEALALLVVDRPDRRWASVGARLDPQVGDLLLHLASAVDVVDVAQLDRRPQQGQLCVRWVDRHRSASALRSRALRTSDREATDCARSGQSTSVIPHIGLPGSASLEPTEVDPTSSAAIAAATDSAERTDRYCGRDGPAPGPGAQQPEGRQGRHRPLGEFLSPGGEQFGHRVGVQQHTRCAAIQRAAGAEPVLGGGAPRTRGDVVDQRVVREDIIEIDEGNCGRAGVDQADGPSHQLLVQLGVR